MLEFPHFFGNFEKSRRLRGSVISHLSEGPRLLAQPPGYKGTYKMRKLKKDMSCSPGSVFPAKDRGEGLSGNMEK